MSSSAWRWRVYPIAIIGSILAALVLVTATSDGVGTLTGRLGGDFVEFYAAGEIVLDGDADRIHELDRQVEAQSQYWDDDGSVILFAYPPAVAAIYAPLAALEFRLAYLIHTLAMIAALGGSVVVLRSLLPILAPAHHRLAALAFALTFLPLFTGITLGQNTALVLLIGSGTWWGLHHRREVLAGVGLGLLMLKPQYGVPLTGLVLLARRWGAVATAAAVTAMLWVASAVLSGPGWIGRWLDLTGSLSEVDQGANLHNEVSWLGLAEVVWGAGSTTALMVAVVLGGVTVAVLLWRLWQRPVLDPLTVALVLPSILLIAPHALYYDAGLLVVAVGALVMALPEQRRPVVLAIWWVGGLGHLGASALGVQPVALLVLGTWAWAWAATASETPVRSRRPHRAGATG